MCNDISNDNNIEGRSVRWSGSGEPGPNEEDWSPALESQWLRSMFLILSISSFASLPFVVLCFHCLSALPVHLPAFFRKCLWPVPLLEVGVWQPCMVVKRSHNQKSHQFGDLHGSGWGRKKRSAVVIWLFPAVQQCWASLPCLTCQYTYVRSVVFSWPRTTKACIHDWTSPHTSWYLYILPFV